MNEAPALTAGSAGVSYPLWIDLVPQAWDIIIAILGATVLVLTAYSKFLEIKERKQRQKNKPKPPHKTQEAE